MVLLKNLINSILINPCRRNLSKFTDSNLKNTLLKMNTEQQSTSSQPNLVNTKKIKVKNTRYAPGTVTLQVLGSGATGSPPVLYLFTDQSRYLFNCGEGTQRLAHEYKMKLSRLEHVFFTRRTWDKMGGLPGLSLTIQEAGVSTVCLHGPPGLDELFTATRKFVVLRDLQIKTVESRTGDFFEDTVMTMHYVPIKRKFGESNMEITENNEQSDISKQITHVHNLENEKFVDTNITNENSAKINTTTHNLENQIDTNLTNENSTINLKEKPTNENSAIEDDTDYYAHELSGTRTKPAQTIPLVNLEERKETEVMSYICRLKPKPGTLDLERCVQLGIKPGPIFGQLKNGIDVTLPDGRVILSRDVRTPDDPGPVFIILDIPSEEYLESLETNKEFEKYQNTARCDSDVASLVVHFTPKVIMDNVKYRRFMNKFSPSTVHIKINETNIYSGSIAVHRLQYQLNQLDRDVFPLLNNVDDTKRKNEFNSPQSNIKRFKSDSDLNKQNEEFNFICENAKTLTNFHLRPKKGLDRSLEPLITPEVYLTETQNVEGFETSLQELKNKLLENTSTINKEYPRVIFLGTGSCIPNKTRNTSGILIQLNDSHNILLDCGEGTFGQFIRHFSDKTELTKIMRDLKTIYISHLHADHHIGLIGLLQERQKLINDTKPITLLAPIQITSWLDFYNKRFEKITDLYQLIPNQNLLLNNDINLKPNGISNIKTCYVKHCPHAFGVMFTILENNFKITYSGDTMPCKNLIELGLNSDLLIHEATMEDDLENEAKYKMHSTVSQAIAVGNKMRARNILLTHFSQRYAKIPRIQNGFIGLNNVGLAFDHMEIGLSDFWKLPVMYDCLKVMFSEHCDELEERAARRKVKRELKNAIK